jgi:hypothetical protein
MKNKNLKIIIIVISIAVITAISIFYGCENDQSNNIQDKSLQMESHFITKNGDGTFVDVFISKTDNQNTNFVINNCDPLPDKGVGIYFSDENVILKQTENDTSLLIELMKDSTCWIIPLDGRTPLKIDPSSNLKLSNGGSVEIICICFECTDGGFKNSCCEKTWYQESNGNRYVKCEPKPDPCKCTQCRTHTVARNGNNSYNYNCSLYIIQSKSITVNGVKYE